jgi:hypothetical protein
VHESSLGDEDMEEMARKMLVGERDSEVVVMVGRRVRTVQRVRRGVGVGNMMEKRVICMLCDCSEVLHQQGVHCDRSAREPALVSDPCSLAIAPAICAKKPVASKSKAVSDRKGRP